MDVADAAAAGDNLEGVARRVRYDFLAESPAKRAPTWVATAHTRDDQAETVLHRLIRGTGLRGLRGIAESPGARPGDPPRPSHVNGITQDVIAYLRDRWISLAGGRDQPRPRVHAEPHPARAAAAAADVQPG